jgi:hypothetical protein
MHTLIPVIIFSAVRFNGNHSIENCRRSWVEPTMSLSPKPVQSIPRPLRNRLCSSLLVPQAGCGPLSLTVTAPRFFRPVPVHALTVSLSTPYPNPLSVLWPVSYARNAALCLHVFYISAAFFPGIINAALRSGTVATRADLQ